jgi:hypothetical protein
MKPTHHLRISWKLLLALLAIFAAIAACAGSNSAIPSPSPNDVATVVAATMQALKPPQATPTLAPPTIAPTATFPLLPPTPVLPVATRINFASGATAGNVSGTIQPGQTIYYVMNAAQGQPMIAGVNSLNNDVTMSIKTAGGTSLVNYGQNLNILLPVSEDYYFAIIGGASTDNFSLSVETPARINFVTGKNKATVSGTTSGDSIVSYVLYAQQNQHMEVDLNGVGQDAALTVWGFSDGQPYIRSVTGATTFSFKLPMTEDYIIDIVPNGSMVVNYTLVVTVK